MKLENDLSAHHRKEKITLDRWISERISANSPRVDLYNFLKENGTYFKETFTTRPPEVPLPQKTTALHCHANSTHYLLTVSEERPELLDKIYFVSGLYGLRANNECVPKNMRYTIDHHSFLLYQNIVLDWTVLNHPLNYYDVDQYFGVVFSARTVIDAIDELVLSNQKNPTVPLMHLKNKEFCNFKNHL